MFKVNRLIFIILWASLSGQSFADSSDDTLIAKKVEPYTACPGVSGPCNVVNYNTNPNAIPQQKSQNNPQAINPSTRH